MMKQLLLDTGWNLHEAPLCWDKGQIGKVMAYAEDWYQCDLPADVRLPLIKNGVIKDPVLSDYCLESEWIEKRSWWFVKRFSLSLSDFEEADIVELVMERLDSEADIFLNGSYLGSHHSVHYPFVGQVKSYLREGENEIVVRVTHGMEKVTQEMLSELNWAVCTEYDNGGKYRGDQRRAFVRRPAYTVGWDWGPKVVTCGITGDVFLRGYWNTAIRDVSVSTEKIQKETAVLNFVVNVEDMNVIGTKSCDLKIDVFDGDVLAASQISERILLTSGYNYLNVKMEIPNARLWWPNGYGEQPLYTVKISVLCEGKKEEYPEFQYGIRTLKLDTSLIAGEDRNFTLIINDVPIFCKGGDWIPNDSIYARVTREKCQTLLAEAKEANFNMLRVWGGGLYERDYFYELCDEMGILLWQDFMFACTTYPDHLDWWRSLVEKELDYQTKRLRSHPSLAVFCGTNENHWIFNQYDNPKWNIAPSHERFYGLAVPNYMAKEAIYKNCPFIPYWNSSPYGGDLPNDDTVGDVHRWHDAFMSPRMENRINLKSYDHIKSKFVSEYGYVGPCCMETTRQYLDLKPAEPAWREGRPWEMHTNVFEKETVYAGIEKHYKDNPDQMSMEDYLLYGGMVQSTILGYSLESIRFKDFCSGALFWMYNDTWGEIGWTIIDYYLRRKISYYGVKRALAPQKLAIRELDGRVVVQALNDGAASIQLQAVFGYLSFDGAVRELRELNLVLEPHSRNYVLDEPLPDKDYRKGTLVVIPKNSSMDPAILRIHEIRDLDYQPAQIQLMAIEQIPEGKRITLTADGYVHGAYIKGNFRCSDNYFDLLPRQVKKVEVYGCEEEELALGQVC